MEVQPAIREFKYNGVALADPNPQHSVTEVRDFYSAIYPEIVSAAIEGPVNAGNKLVYEFRKAVGTKGES
jgi:PRTRC genetic system protein C